VIVVIDTNVWISALLFSRPGSIPELALQRAVRQDTIAISKEMLEEIYRILQRKGAWNDDRIETVLGLYLKRALIVTLTNTTHICRDPKDNMFLECSSIASAKVLVSGDIHLLELGQYKGTRILKPANYLELQ